MLKTTILKSIMILISGFLLKNDLIFLSYHDKDLAVKTCQKFKKIDLYYNSAHTSDTIYSSYNDTTYYYSTLSIPIGRDIPIYFDRVNVIGAEDCYSKTSWGNSAYYGTEMWKIVNNRKFLNFIPNVKVVSFAMIKKYSNIGLLDIKKYYMSAYIVSKLYVGFTWYYNNYNHQFYLELLVYFYTYVWGSSIGGARWLNIGKGLEITSLQ